MSEPRWVVVEEVAGPAQAGILHGWLEALGIQAIISQESLGQYSYPVTFGNLGRVQILVSQEDEAQAREVLQAYWERTFEAPEDQEDEPE